MERIGKMKKRLQQSVGVPLGSLEDLLEDLSSLEDHVGVAWELSEMSLGPLWELVDRFSWMCGTI